jgi:hypothetical protein
MQMLMKGRESKVWQKFFLEAFEAFGLKQFQVINTGRK